MDESLRLDFVETGQGRAKDDLLVAKKDDLIDDSLQWNLGIMNDIVRAGPRFQATSEPSGNAEA